MPCTPKSPGESANEGAPDDQRHTSDDAHSGQPAIRGWQGRVRMEDRYDTDIDDLWSALTDPRRLARWIAEVKGDLRLGGEFHARFTSSWEGAGRVDACEPPRRLLLTMSPGQDDETVIEARLAAAGDQTRLVIEERGLPRGELAARGAGWQAHVEDLAAH